MFDLDIIEQDWKNNSFKLNEDEIRDIFCVEGVTHDVYVKELFDYNKKVYGDDICAKFFLQAGLLDINEEQRKVIENILVPTKKRLSKASQQKIVEGSMDIVFDETRKWYNYLSRRISLEQIYYLCLEALINSVKYMLHNGKRTFKYYVIKSMEVNIIEYIAKIEHITYKETYKKIYNCSVEKNNNSLFLIYENKEIPEKPSKILYLLGNSIQQVDYIENISATQFMLDYEKVLESLDETEKLIMQLTFDIYGYRGFTNMEIGKYLGLSSNKVSKIRSKAKKKIRENNLIKTYLL